MGAHSRRGGLLVGIVLLVAACGGGDDDAGGDGDGGRVDRRTHESPLTEFFGSMVDASDDRVAEQQRRVEAEIAACMEAQGFEYTPVESDFSTPEEGPFDLPDKEFVEKYGFGRFTIDWEEEGFADSHEDPNQERIDAMSEAERAAYEAALWGEVDEETGEQLDSGGCSGEAWDDETGSEEEFVGLFEEMDAVYTRIEENDRVRDAARGWANCMADAGYPDLEDPELVIDLVHQRYEEMAPEPSAEGVGEEGEEGDVSESSEFDSTYGLDPQQLEELRAYEIEVATADYECRGEYDRVYVEVQTELEEEFIEENREELERYRDATSAAGDG